MKPVILSFVVIGTACCLQVVPGAAKFSMILLQIYMGGISQSPSSNHTSNLPFSHLSQEIARWILA